MLKINSNASTAAFREARKQEPLGNQHLPCLGQPLIGSRANVVFAQCFSC